MMHVLKRAWTGAFGSDHALQRHTQVAALCYRGGDNARQVLLITSRDTGRWIIPKGWPIEGLDAAGSALQEAWEEAGVRRADINATPLGTFDYDKRLRDGAALPIRTEVFAAKVLEMREDFPEALERQHAWFTPEEAADLVDEPELQALLRNF